MNVGIVGVGVVGEATAKVFSRVHKVYLYDKYKEPYTSNSNLEKLVGNSEVIFISVPTPMQPNGAIDYTAIYSSVELIDKTAKKQGKNPRDTLLTIRSTTVSGTTDKLAEIYPFFRFAFNPEFLREKHANKDMERTDRVVIGVNDALSERQLLDVYKPLFPNAKYTITDRKTAEMIKCATNVFLAGQIALANEIFQICRNVGVDYDKVKEVVLQDNRIGKNINVPGHDRDFGFGGKCLPKDLNALIHLAREHWYKPYLLDAIWNLNERVRKKKDWLEIPGANSENNQF